MRSLPTLQQGFTLIELMVGIAIGLLVIAVSMAALMVSRSVSGTVSDASGIQQQSAYVMRIIGLQMRQAGSLYLNLDPGNLKTGYAYARGVAFETTAEGGSGMNFDPSTDTIQGTASPVTLSIGYRRYKEPVYTHAAEQALARNCLGGPDNDSSDARIDNVFQLNGNQLQCSGNGDNAQTLAQNVSNFQIRYLAQNNKTPGNPLIQYVAAADTEKWNAQQWAMVQAVEVCLVVYGNEPIDVPSGSTYVDCDGKAVDMTKLTGQRARRMHIAYRNVFQLRSQGLVGSVL
ncbi:PilW family protein [Delftia sp. NA_296.1]|uniref:PilW family protein n=1 Tax=Delftia TaxID=80865 RepID=UPI00333F035D